MPTIDPEERLANLIARKAAEIVIRHLEQTEKRRRREDRYGVLKVPVALLNPVQAAKYLGRTVRAIRDLERRGDLPAVRHGRSVQFSRRQLDEFIESHGG